MSDTTPSPLPPAAQRIGQPSDPAPADQVAARLAQIVLQHELPGQWAGNKLEQLQHDTGIVSIAIEPFLDAVMGARFVVQEKKQGRTVRKSVAGLGQSSRDNEYEPADDDHPLWHILANPGGPGGDWSIHRECAYLMLQKKLTGDAPVWMPANEDGQPCQFFALTGASVQANIGAGINERYPSGSYRLIQPAGNTMWFGGFGAGSAVLPAEQVHFYRNLHPYWRNAGYSRLQAGAREIDVLEAITNSRWSYFDQGLQLDTVVYLPGADAAQCEAVKQQLEQRHGGARKARQVLVIGGAGASDLAGKPLNVTALGPPVREMDYTQSYEQAAKIALALYKVPGVLAGLQESGSYAADWAAQQRFYDIALVPEMRNLSEFLTLYLAKPWCEFDRQFRIEVEIDPPRNVESQERVRQFAAEKGFISVNTFNRMCDFPVVPDGDVPLAVYLAKQQQAATPQPDPMALPGGPQQPPAPAEGGKPGDPLSGLLERKDGPEEPRQKAMNTLDDSAGGVLVPPACSPAEKRRKKKRLVADVLKRL